MKNELHLDIETHLNSRFFNLLQQGFMVEAQSGCNVKTLLCEQFGISPEYLDKRIQTIFLDGRSVDNVNSTIIRNGSTLTLSAAMPGVVGAVLRKGGYYASMRRQISHIEKTRPQDLKGGMIVLKLFNLLLKELGPTFLNRGIWLEGNILEDFFRRQPNDFWAGCKAATWDGKNIDPNLLTEMKWANKNVYLKLRGL